MPRVQLPGTGLLAIPFLLLLLPAAALAQETTPERTKSVQASIGLGVLHDGDGSRGPGVDVGAGFVYRVHPRLGLAFEVDYWRHEHKSAEYTFEGDGLFATGNLRVSFLQDRPHQIYASVGLGLMSYHRNDLLPPICIP